MKRGLKGHRNPLYPSWSIASPRPQESTNHTPSTDATGHLCYCACQTDPPIMEMPNKVGLCTRLFS